VHLLPSAPALGLAVVLALAAPAAEAADPGHLAQPAPHARSFVGPDGTTYASAPLTVPGLDGELFYGPDFDVACGLGSRTSRNMKQVAKLARVIERSGRTVVWTVAPNKSTVRLQDLPDPMPHGACDARGFRQERRVLDGVADHSFLPLSARLAGFRHQTYFKTDTHWTTVGGSIFARALAHRLEPRVARLQSYSYGTEERVGNLNFFDGIETAETAETAMPTTKVHVRTAGTSVDQVWSGYPQVTFDYTWNSRPARRTVPGDTLVLGDSFSMFALDSLMPLFERGRFLWRGKGPERVEFQAIKRADTVVIEVGEVLASLGASVADPGYRKRLRRALR
jgi:alginate O-acetyltransferase complex protein AlgJ